MSLTDKENTDKRGFSFANQYKASLKHANAQQNKSNIAQRAVSSIGLRTHNHISAKGQTIQNGTTSLRSKQPKATTRTYTRHFKSLSNVSSSQPSVQSKTEQGPLRVNNNIVN